MTEADQLNCLGMWVGGQKEDLQRAEKKLLGVTDIFSILNVVMIAQVCTYVKIYQTDHFKCIVNFMFKTK